MRWKTARIVPGLVAALIWPSLTVVAQSDGDFSPEYAVVMSSAQPTGQTVAPTHYVELQEQDQPVSPDVRFASCQQTEATTCGNPGGLLGALLFGPECEQQSQLCDRQEGIPSSTGCRWCACGTIEGSPWELPVPCRLQRLGVDWGGWLSTGVYANARGSESNGPLGFREENDGWTLDQLYFYVARPANTACRWFDIGFRADLVFGADGPDTQAFGGHHKSFDNQWDSGGVYGWAMPQLYAEVAVGNLNVKFGHFYTITGYEAVTAPDNFFYSHAYAMYWGEPFTHTGVLAECPLGKYLTLYGGWTQGWDTGFDNTPRADTFLGGMSVQLTDRTSLTYATSFGQWGAKWDLGHIYMHSIVLQVRLTNRLQYVLHHDLGLNNNPAGDREWYSFAQYWLYDLSDCLSAGMRLECFRDDDAARISFNGPAVGNYWEVTWGLNWRPHANVVVRPELRYDWLQGSAAPGQEPFDGGLADDQFAGGVDIVVTF